MFTSLICVIISFAILAYVIRVADMTGAANRDNFECWANLFEDCDTQEPNFWNTRQWEVKVD